MSRSWSSEAQRGQTEPIAALVAVAAVCMALSLYAGYVAEVTPGERGRAVEDATLERAWDALETNGVYDPSVDPATAIDAADLPPGYAAAITVTTAGENGPATVVAEAQFGPDGSPVDGPRADPTRSIDPDAASRPVAVSKGSGDVRGGRLTVEVWR